MPHPQLKPIWVERLHRTLLDEDFRVMGRTKFYEGVDEMQVDLEAFLKTYNNDRPPQGRGMNGRLPAKTFTDGLPRPDKARKKTKTETRKAA